MPILADGLSLAKSYICIYLVCLNSNNMHLYFNGQFLDDSKSLPITKELSFLRGFAIFDFFGVRGGVPLFIEDYMDRFYRSAALVGLTVPVDREALIKDIHELIKINGFRKAYCKIILTGGFSPDGFRPGDPNIYIMPQPLVEHPEERYLDGVKIITDAYKRETPEVKTTNYMNAIMKIPEMDAAGAVEILYHDGGQIRECSRCNIFLVKDEKIITPSSEILKGITRKQILAIAHEHYEVEERDVEVGELKDADEVFITSSTKMLFPVVNIDGDDIADGFPGPISEDLLEKMKAWTTAYIQEQLKA